MNLDRNFTTSGTADHYKRAFWWVKVWWKQRRLAMLGNKNNDLIQAPLRLGWFFAISYRAACAVCWKTWTEIHLDSWMITVDENTVPNRLGFLSDGFRTSNQKRWCFPQIQPKVWCFKLFFKETIWLSGYFWWFLLLKELTLYISWIWKLSTLGMVCSPATSKMLSPNHVL